LSLVIAVAAAQTMTNESCQRENENETSDSTAATFASLPSTTTRHRSFRLFTPSFQHFESSFSMGAIRRIVPFLMISHDFKGKLEIKCGQSPHALYQNFALLERQGRRLFFYRCNRRSNGQIKQVGQS
jgi:hypothetical protein